ncbi:MAG TPA: protein translocase subunit SecD [Verrucomicrobiae bacterium]|jgi:SecD/SecF fusion protein|nr:protein translocase subunit SecD [Verrucomicrobiae bacterium]
MNRNNLWRFILVVAVVAWAAFEIYPPTNRDLIQVFRENARGVDENFMKIVQRAQDLTKERPQDEYGNLVKAIDTNDIAVYFPQFTKLSQTHPTTSILNAVQREAMGNIHLGIDLQGGTSFLVEMDTNNLVSVETITNKLGQAETVTNSMDISGALSQAVEVLRKRVDQFGVAEPVIQPEGNNRISIQLPGLSDEQMNEAETNISKAAFLEFYLVNQDSANLLKEGVSVPGYKVMTSERTLQNGTKSVEHYLVKKNAEMVGGISSAWVSRDNFGRPQIEFRLDSAHSDKFYEITKANVGRQLAIVLDGELQTAPRINDALNGGGQITGDYSDEEARTLVNVLQNPLQAPVHIIDKNRVDPTLGKDSISSGIKASVYGIIAVAGFMVVYYGIAGAVADMALILNIIILLGVMCSIDTTLTLPGIAGVVLTVGMAVDANVLIFERIREESSKGKSLRGAVEAGYDRAFGTIFDSHVTTLISSIILIFMGTGSVKGFGVSLTIGVAASLFTALVVTRLIFDFLISRNLIKKLPMLHLIPATMKLDFMKWAKPAFAASWLLIIIGISYGIHRGSDVFGVEFTGGEKMVLSVDPQHKPGVDEVRKAATTVSGREVLVAYQRNVATGRDTLQVTARTSAKGDNAGVADKIFQALKAKFPDANFGDKPLSLSDEGPIVGQEIQQAAIIASLLAMFGILIYVAFRYEFSFAVGAVVAIIHDVLMTLGWYFLAHRELNATTVAAVLTIIGFSINDTIVIFDRIREDLRLGVRGTFRELMNQALNQTLSRTIITSGTVFLATMSLFIFGGGEINDFAFTFLIGIITGTYSSIYIASALVLWWHKGQRPKIGASTQLAVEPNAPAR